MPNFSKTLAVAGRFTTICPTVVSSDSLVSFVCAVAAMLISAPVGFASIIDIKVEISSIALKKTAAPVQAGRGHMEQLHCVAVKPVVRLMQHPPEHFQQVVHALAGCGAHGHDFDVGQVLLELVQ